MLGAEGCHRPTRRIRGQLCDRETDTRISKLVSSTPAAQSTGPKHHRPCRLTEVSPPTPKVSPRFCISAAALDASELFTGGASGHSEIVGAFHRYSQQFEIKVHHSVAVNVSLPAFGDGQADQCQDPGAVPPDPSGRILWLTDHLIVFALPSGDSLFGKSLRDDHANPREIHATKECPDLSERPRLLCASTCVLIHDSSAPAIWSYPIRTTPMLPCTRQRKPWGSPQTTLFLSTAISGGTRACGSLWTG